MKIEEWYNGTKIKIGEEVSRGILRAMKRLLYTWRDLFVIEVGKMPATDLVYHYISTWPGSTPLHEKERLFTPEESRWMEDKIPEMLKAGILEYSVSLCAHRTKFVRKKKGSLRIVHVFCPINSATVNHSYPMKRIDPVINNLTQAKYKLYFQVDATNGFWAVPLYPPYAYKTAFTTSLGQFQYKRMG